MTQRRRSEQVKNEDRPKINIFLKAILRKLYACITKRSMHDNKITLVYRLSN